jgi:hypothetical protein
MAVSSFLAVKGICLSSGKSNLKTILFFIYIKAIFMLSRQIVYFGSVYPRLRTTPDRDLLPRLGS